MTVLLQSLTFLCALHVSFAVQAPTIKLNDGNSIPMVALGTGRGTAPKGTDVEEVRHSVLWALEAGYRHIDTATLYKDEEQVGQGIADAIAKGVVKREDIFVTTKLWCDKHARDSVVPALQVSLKKLNLDYVDLYLIHYPIATKADGAPDDVDYLDTWKGMEEAKRLGLTKSIGVSNFNSEQLDRIFANSDIKPAVNQIEVNPTLTQYHLVEHSQKLGLAVMAYSPFGYLVGRSGPKAPPPRSDDPLLQELSTKYGKTPNQIVLRYLINRGLIPIPKSTNQVRIGQNIDLFDFELTAPEVAAIDRFNQNVRVINIEHWKNYPYYPFNKD